MGSLKTEPRFVAFIDVLGFREVLKGPVERIDAYYSLLTMNRSLASDGISVSMLGDAIVLSIPVGEGRQQQLALQRLTQEIALIQWRLALSNIWTRGAVTRGDVHFSEDGFFVSHALARAYELESTVAKYPRVILDPKILDFPEMREDGIMNPGDLIDRLVTPAAMGWDGKVLYDWADVTDRAYVKGDTNERFGAQRLEKDVPLFVDYLGPLYRKDMHDKAGSVVAFLETRCKDNIEHYQKYIWVAKYLLATLMKNPDPHPFNANHVIRLHRL